MCRSESVASIELAAAKGFPISRVARTYGVGRNVIARHMRGCVSAKLAIAAAGRREVFQATDVLTELVALYGKVQLLLDETIASSAKPDAVARVVREQRETLGMIGKLTGAFPQTHGSTTNVDNRTQIVALKDMSVEDLRSLIRIGEKKA